MSLHGVISQRVDGNYSSVRFSAAVIFHFRSCDCSWDVMVQGRPSVSYWLICNLAFETSSRTESAVNNKFVCVVIPFHPGLSGCYVTNTNFLSKQDPASFHNLVLSHILVALPAPDRSQLHFGTICSGNMIYILLYAACVSLCLTYCNEINVSKAAQGTAGKRIHVTLIVPQKFSIVRRLQSGGE